MIKQALAFFGMSIFSVSIMAAEPVTPRSLALHIKPLGSIPWK